MKHTGLVLLLLAGIMVTGVFAGGKKEKEPPKNEPIAIAVEKDDEGSTVPASAPMLTSTTLRLVMEKDLVQLSYAQKESIQFYTNIWFALKRFLPPDTSASVEEGKLTIENKNRGEEIFIPLELPGRVGVILPNGSLGIYFGNNKEIDRAKLLYFAPTNRGYGLVASRDGDNLQKVEYGGNVYTVTTPGGRPYLLTTINEITRHVVNEINLSGSRVIEEKSEPAKKDPPPSGREENDVSVLQENLQTAIGQAEAILQEATKAKNKPWLKDNRKPFTKAIKEAKKLLESKDKTAIDAESKKLEELIARSIG